MNRQKYAALILALRNRPAGQNTRLQELRLEGEVNSQRHDWLWHLLLSSMSTMGNSRGYQGLILNEQNYRLVSYDTLIQLNADERLQNLQTGLSQATVRRYNSKAIWLNNNFKFIIDCGGLTIIQNLLLQTNGRESKLRLMKVFEGVGNKYARNIFMDLHHPDFISSIAIDERLIDISEELEIDIPNITYNEHENIFIDIAQEANLSPWELDRLLYNYKSYYVSAMNNGI